MRKPRTHEFFGAANDVGLSNVLEGQLPFSEAVERTDGGIWVLAGGTFPTRPAELLQSPAMAELLAAARKQFDFVIVDCPPVLGLADCLAVLPLVDAVLFVVQADKTHGGADPGGRRPPWTRRRRCRRGGHERRAREPRWTRSPQLRLLRCFRGLPTSGQQTATGVPAPCPTPSCRYASRMGTEAPRRPSGRTMRPMSQRGERRWCRGIERRDRRSMRRSSPRRSPPTRPDRKPLVLRSPSGTRPSRRGRPPGGSRASTPSALGALEMSSAMRRSSPREAARARAPR